MLVRIDNAVKGTQNGISIIKTVNELKIKCVNELFLYVIVFNWKPSNENGSSTNLHCTMRIALANLSVKNTWKTEIIVHQAILMSELYEMMPESSQMIRQCLPKSYMQ